MKYDVCKLWITVDNYVFLRFAKIHQRFFPRINTTDDDDSFLKNLN